MTRANRREEGHHASDGNWTKPMVHPFCKAQSVGMTRQPTLDLAPAERLWTIVFEESKQIDTECNGQLLSPCLHSIATFAAGRGNATSGRTTPASASQVFCSAWLRWRWYLCRTYPQHNERIHKSSGVSVRDQDTQHHHCKQSKGLLFTNICLPTTTYTSIPNRQDGNHGKSPRCLRTKTSRPPS